MKREPISRAEFWAKYKRTGVSREAIFSQRKPLLDEIYATGNPVYCNESYYTIAQTFYPVVKVGDHFECNGYGNFENWRDCHYYNEYADLKGNKVWLVTGGRYD